MKKKINKIRKPLLVRSQKGENLSHSREVQKIKTAQLLMGTWSNRKMKLILNIPERIVAINLFNEQKGSISQLAMMMDDIKQCNFSATESVEIGLRTEGMNIKWNPEKVDYVKEVDLTEEGKKYLIDKINEKTDFTVDQFAIVKSLQEKLIQ